MSPQEKYCRADAELTFDVHQALSQLPPPSAEWLAANPDRWVRRPDGTLHIFK